MQPVLVALPGAVSIGEHSSRIGGPPDDPNII